MKQFTLSEYCNIIMGQSPKSQYYNTSKNGTPFVQGCTDFTKKYPKITTWTTNYNKLASTNDILLSVRAPVGTLNIAPCNLAIGRGIASISAKSGSNKYLYYLLTASQNKLKAFSTGTIFESISKKQLEDVIINVHDTDIQQHIVDILGSIDDKIENNENLILKLEELALYKYQLLTDARNCTTVKMCDVFDIKIGRTPPRKEYQWFSKDRNDVKWVSISDLGRSNIYISNSTETLTADAIKRFNIPIVPSNTVILSFKLTVGKVSITNNELTTNEAIAHFIPKYSDNITKFLYCYLKQYDFDKLGSTSSIATAVNSKYIKNMNFLLPSDEVLNEFNKVVNPLFDKIKILINENTKLEELKQLYLKKFFD